MGLLQQIWLEKAFHGVETLSFPGKEKVLYATVSNESPADSHLEYKSTHHFWFPFMHVKVW